MSPGLNVSELLKAATHESAQTFGASSIRFGVAPQAGTTATLASSGFVLIPDYAQTTYDKTLWAGGSSKRGTSSTDVRIEHMAGFWRSTSAISSITIFAGSGNIDAGSAFTLYGIE